MPCVLHLLVLSQQGKCKLSEKVSLAACILNQHCAGGERPDHARGGEGSFSKQQERHIAASGLQPHLPLGFPARASMPSPDLWHAEASDVRAAGGAQEPAGQASLEDSRAVADDCSQQQHIDKLYAQLDDLHAELARARQEAAETTSSAALEVSQAHEELELLRSGKEQASSLNGSASHKAETQADLQLALQQLANSQAAASSAKTDATLEISQAYEELELAQSQLETARAADVNAATADLDPKGPATADLSSKDQQCIVNAATTNDTQGPESEGLVEEAEHQRPALSTPMLRDARQSNIEGLMRKAVRLQSTLQQAQQDCSQAQAQQAGLASELEAARAEHEMLQRALSTAQADAQAAMRMLQAERDGQATTEAARAAAAKVSHLDYGSDL